MGVRVPCLTTWRHPNVLGYSNHSHIKFWLGWLDLNQRMRESKSRALPLGDTPKKSYGVSIGFRTLDLQSHNLALYLLSYTHHMVCLKGFEPPTLALEGRCSIQLSYRHIKTEVCPQKHSGAGDGNRTHAASLEGWNSTIELHPHKIAAFVTFFVIFSYAHYKKMFSATCLKIITRYLTVVNEFC